MIPYYILIFVPAALVLIQSRYPVVISGIGEKKRVVPGITTFFAILFALLALRSVECGTDLVSYIYIFERDASWSYEQIFSNLSGEWLYHFLNRLIYQVFNGNRQIFLAIIAFISLLPLYIFYKKETENPYLTIILFCTVAPFSMYFSGLRQICAMAFAIPAFYCAKNKKLVWFLITVAIAVLFHTSALIIVLIYPLYWMKVRRQHLLFVIPMFILLYVFRSQIFTFLLTTVFTGYGEKYTTEASSTCSYAIFILFILLAVFSYVVTDETELDQDTLAMRNILLLSVVLQGFASINSVAMRFNYYFLLFIPILIPKIINRSSVKYAQVARIASYVLIVFFTFYFFYNAYTGADVLNVFPYVAYWE